MLTNITLENFKAFQKLNNLKVKPVTILCGTNSCGKSSILQSILLFKQTLESKNPNQNLLLNGRFVKLGTFHDVVFRKDTENIISFDFTFDILPNLYNKKDRKTPIEPLLRELFYNKPIPKLAEFIVNYSVSLNLYKDEEQGELLNVVNIIVKVAEKQGIFQPITISIKHQSEDLYEVEWSNVENRFGYIGRTKQSGIMQARIQFENLLPSSFRFENISILKSNSSANLKDRRRDTRRDDRRNIEGNDRNAADNISYDEANFQNLRTSLYKINDLLQSIFSFYSYVGPLRQSHKDGGTYFGADITEIGNSGENAPFLFLKEKGRTLRDHYFYNKNYDTFLSQETITLENAFDEWFKVMGIEGFGGTETKRIINLYLNANRFDDTQIDISQVGFGVSQMFPIILEGLRMDKGSTLLLEQPEIHLHPNLQMQMADFFIALALSGKNVIAETHSDHIVNRLVRRIVEDETHDLKDKIGIYFIKPSENGSVYEEINIDDAKGITNWPVDFFDQAANEQMRIMQAGLKKRKNQRTIAKV